MTGPVPISLELLRQEARDELDAVIEFRCRMGDDPWDIIPDLPTVDEHVVHTLRADTLAARDLSEAAATPHHSASHRSPRAVFEYDLLRQIALEHPDLTPAVWRLMGQLDGA